MCSIFKSVFYCYFLVFLVIIIIITLSISKVIMKLPRYDELMVEIKLKQTTVIFFSLMYLKRKKVDNQALGLQIIKANAPKEISNNLLFKSFFLLCRK